jgi:nigerose phosphorylase
MVQENKSWIYRIEGFSPEECALNGNRFMLGNGYMGYRGTLEEFGKEQLVGCMLNGVYDQVAGKWREPVNAPNGLFARIEGAGKIVSHAQELDVRFGHVSRHTVYENVSVTSSRFVSQDDVHLICMEYTVRSVQPGRITIHTGIDADVWDINGPHLQDVQTTCVDDVLRCVAHTGELGITVAVCEAIEAEVPASGNKAMRTLEIDAEAGREYTFRKYISIFTSLDNDDPVQAAHDYCLRAQASGYAELAEAHDACWNKIWQRCDVRIDGDDEAQFALRYSLYQLQLAAPRHSDRVSIPARALSGQVYKGAVFWDTEMFMTPVFALTDPVVARNLILYRYHTLEGAREKAAEYGFRGAYYAWEGQERGNDACSHFNVTDVFTNRPMRTYFRDKQIHISADIVYAIWKYYEQTGDFSVFADGAAEVVAECARFFYSHAYYKKGKQRYELLDVTGPDEYHERVNNNAYTNRMAKFTLDTAILALELLEKRAPEEFQALDNKIGFLAELDDWRDMASRLWLPAPDETTGIIPQFDGYEKLEDLSLAELKNRVLDPNEYWGGGNGVATTTKILKQADVVLMLNLFKDEFPAKTIAANWEYYEPRTEHGSSLSACAYAMVAAHIGKPDWAYDYFMKTATVDLTGKSKQYVGPLYIGGTHPAANGGAWLSAIFGFAGLHVDERGIHIKPSLPSHWKGMSFSIEWQGVRYSIEIKGNDASVVPCKENCYA